MARTRDQAVVDDMRQQLQDVVDDFMASRFFMLDVPLLKDYPRTFRRPP
jgi:hypothetical protein